MKKVKIAKKSGKKSKGSVGIAKLKKKAVAELHSILEKKEELQDAAADKIQEMKKLADKKIVSLEEFVEDKMLSASKGIKKKADKVIRGIQERKKLNKPARK